jgi:hypothetical protein
MKKVLIAAALSVGFTAVSQANDNAPAALADAEMDQIVAGRAHQGEIAPTLQGGVADLVPEHVMPEDPGHQRAAADLKGDIVDFVPDHVRRN